MAATTRDMLIEAGNDLFFQHGFHAVGLDQILARVGVTKTTFYNHFESKDDLVIAVLHERDKRETEEWMSIVRARGQGDAKAEILAFFDLVEEWLASPDFRGCMFLKAASEYPSPNDPVHKAARVHGENFFREIRQRAAKAGAANPDGVASQLMLLLTGAILSRHSRGVPDQARPARVAAGVIVESALGSMSVA
jgi:AcrR family transcriptional regulator